MKLTLIKVSKQNPGSQLSPKNINYISNMKPTLGYWIKLSNNDRDSHEKYTLNLDSCPVFIKHTPSTLMPANKKRCRVEQNF